MIDFPSAPTNGDEFVGGGITWVWNGTGWTVKPAAGGGTGEPPIAAGLLTDYWRGDKTWQPLDHIASADMWAGFNKVAGYFTVHGTADGSGGYAFAVGRTGSDSGLAWSDDSVPAGPALGLKRYRTTPANGDLLGAISFFGNNSVGTEETFASIGTASTIVTAGATQGIFAINVANNSGQLKNVANFTTTAVSLAGAVLLGDPPIGQHPTGGARLVVDFSGGNAQYGINCFVTASVPTTAMVFGYTPNTTVGSISMTAAATAYNTSSDERLKTFNGELTGAEAAAVIRADPARRFTWNELSGADGEEAVGWGAQTSYGVSPDLASPPPAVILEASDPAPREEGFQPWGMDQSKRAPYLWAALSWALDRIDTLEARLAALEAAP